ncbi:hypothetical protein BY996DRAFT_6465620, partial [Phakopsora pachyrhizi]
MVSRSVDILVSEFCSRSSLDDYLSRGSLTHSSGLVQSNVRRYRKWLSGASGQMRIQCSTCLSQWVIKRLLLVVPSNEEDDYRPIEGFDGFRCLAAYT